MMLSNKTFFDHTSTAHKLSGYVSTECFVWNWKYRTCGTESGKLIFTSTPTGKFASLRTSTGTALNNFARHFGEMLSLNQLVSVPQSRRQQATRSQAGTAEISSFPRFSVTSWEFIPRGRLAASRTYTPALLVHHPAAPCKPESRTSPAQTQSG